MLNNYKMPRHGHVGNGIACSAGSDNTGETNRKKTDLIALLW